MLDYQLQQIYSSLETKLSPQEKSNYVIQIAEILSQIKNPVILDEYIKVASFKLDVSENILKNQVKSNQQDENLVMVAQDNDFVPIRKALSNDDQYETMEENLIKLAFCADNDEKKNFFKENSSTYLAQNQENQKILDVIDKCILEINNVDELAKKIFLEFYNNQNIQKKISDNIFSSQQFNNLSTEDYKKAIAETLTRLKKLKQQNKKEELKKLLKDDSLSEEEKLKISTQIFQELKQK